MKILTKLAAIFDRALNLLSVFAGAMLAFTMLAVTYTVVVRQMARPTAWMIEISGYILLWITFLSTAWLLRRGEHVRMDLVLNRLNPRAQARLNLITSIIGAAICLIVARYSAEATWVHFQLGYIYPGELYTPKFLVLSIIPIGSSLLFIQFLRQAFGYRASWKAPSNKQ